MSSLLGHNHDGTHGHQQFYELVVTTAAPLTPVVKLAEMKASLKLPSGDGPDDDFLTLLLDASTQSCEKALGREIRVRTFNLFLDDFPARILLKRNPVDSITSVDRLVSGTFTAVSSSVYYLKNHTQVSEILLNSTESWPTDQDTIEHAVRVVFVTKAGDCVDMAKAAIHRHVAFMYENRGDCDPANSDVSFRASGARGLVIRSGIQKV